MTSKEALGKLVAVLLRQELKDVESNKTREELCEIVLKDLEVLELLKTKRVNIGYVNTLYECFKDIGPLARLTQDELEIIKEWLENE